MCFPWNHDVVPVIRNFPKDIDELPAVLQADDDEFTPFQNGVYGYGGFEVGKERRTAHDQAVIAHGDTYLAATRRTNDVGVIELTVIDNERVLGESSRLRKRKHDETVDGDDGADSKSKEPPKDALPAANSENKAKTEVIMRQEEPNEPAACYSYSDNVRASFEHAKAVKERKVAMAEENTHRMLVSVRFGSTSSRSTVLAPFGGNHNSSSQPLLAHASIPTRKNRNQVANYATGGWDTDRAKWLKRDHLAWTQSSSSAGGYLSKLSFNTMPSVNAKKPRDVRVGIRVDGELLSFEPAAGDTRPPASIAASLLGVAEDSIHEAPVPKPPQQRQQVPIVPSMCMLDLDKLSDVKVTFRNNRPDYPRKPPILDCVSNFLGDGAIHVVCSSPGTLQPTNLTAIFIKPQNICTICWTDQGDLKTCTKCDLKVHPSCCAHGGVTSGGNWTCAVCAEGPPAIDVTQPPPPFASPRKRTTNVPARYQSENMVLDMSLPRAESPDVIGNLPVCALCPHYGGAMSPCGNGKWCHEVCRIWSPSTDQSSTITKSSPFMPTSMSKCALCGIDKGPVIKCGGAGCMVRFHPMCAIVCMLDPNAQCRDLHMGMGSNDHRMCRQFTIDIADCNGDGEMLVPMGFCGLHNPSREPFLYGCYPNGMAPAMRVPANEQPQHQQGGCSQFQPIHGAN